MTYGQKLAKDEFEAYQKGKMSKRELAAACDWARINAAFGDEEAQQIGSDYLYKMQELGFIKGLRRVD